MLVANCVICKTEPGEGGWQLCPECRAELAEKSARRMASMHPAFCLGCSRERPVVGVYCRRCNSRFAKEGPKVGNRAS
jgi:hypothetical protein